MSEPTVNVVLIEDDRHIRRYVRATLEREAMRVFEADTGQEGLAIAATARPDLVIVDLGLPDIDGQDVIRQLRGWSSVPVIVLSGRTREEEKVGALDAGADDYLTKPFGVAELMARIRAQLRRQERCMTADSAKVSFGAVTVDLTTRSVLRDGESVHLTAIEYRLLVALVRHAGRVLTHRQLLEEVWGPAHAENANYLRIYMANLRHKLEREPARPEYIVTETGVGYCLVGVR
ncbi:MAG TPA: response regulator [Paraburkholderia sp.]|uniref:response regulator n=1 Tax=Paraburkholderia sp. TaxID=1926495 RepID=UPI002CD0BCB8|nr:response regulator [Paraburkholderia sp.]HTR10173.1 response regulator [Paraburkholderia sp.]